MRITISQKLNPFSHTPGTNCLIPGTKFGVQIFPTLIRLYDLTTSSPKLISETNFELTGPVREFTVEQDLEKGAIRVWGHYQEAYMRYNIQAKENSILLNVERGPEKYSKVLFSIDQTSSIRPPTERLSLGSHKKLDWDLIKRRLELEDILPIWLRLGQWTPELKPTEYYGTATMLNELKEPLTIYQTFLNIFLAGFEGILFPRLIDTQYQGFKLPEIPHGSDISPLILLKEGALQIRKLFIQQDNAHIHILPLLPPQFHAGRFINIDCGKYGLLDIEWSKKQIKRLIFQAENNSELYFHFSKEFKKFRLRKREGEKGAWVECGAALAVEAGQTYLLDNFQK